MKWHNWQWGLFSILIIIDQVSKSWATQQGIVTYNSGISFGLFGALPPFVLTLLVMVLAAGAAWWWHTSWPDARLASVLFWSGAVGNIFDRLFFGAVRDFLPTPLLVASKNNLADWYIALGLCWLVWQLFRERRAITTRHCI